MASWASERVHRVVLCFIIVIPGRIAGYIEVYRYQGGH